MTTYKTKALTVGDLTVTVSKAGKSAAEKIVAFLEALADRLDSEGTIPGGGGHPDQGLPPGGVVGGGPADKPGAHPDHDLPSGGHVGGKPPGTVDRPDQGLPGDQPEAGQLPSFIRENAEEIAKAILKGTACDPDKEPK